MKICSWNVNGLRSVINKGEFQKFTADQRPDVICLQETKARREQVEIDLPDYEEYWNSAERAGYSGTAILVHRDVLATVVDVTPDLPTDLAAGYGMTADSFGDPNTEGRVLTLELPDFFLTTVYTPNSKEDLSRLDLRASQWDPGFGEYMARLKANKPVVFCGDLNVAAQPIDLANPTQNEGKHGYTRQERAGFQAFLDNGFVDSFRSLHPDQVKYSWWSHWARARERNIGWRIDYFLVDERLRGQITAADILDQQVGSDHAPILLDLCGTRAIGV